MNTPAKKILWIDDDYYELKGLLRKVEEQGVIVEYATSVSEAYTRVIKKQEIYDLIIVDMILPIQDEHGETDEDIKGWRNSKIPLGVLLVEYFIKNIPTKLAILSIVFEPKDKYHIQIPEGKEVVYIPKREITTSRLCAQIIDLLRME